MPDEQLKKLEKKLETLISGVHSQMLVLHESTRDDIRIVAEGVAALDARMERGFKAVRRELAGHERRLGMSDKQRKDQPS